MTEFSFKKAPLRGAERWTLENGVLTRDGGEPSSLSLSDVTGGHFADMRAQRMQVAYFDLESPSGRLRIACNDRPRGQDRMVFLTLCRAVASDLAQRQADIDIKVGGGRAMRLFFAILGVATLVFGIVFAGAALTGSSGRNDLIIMLVGGAFALFGAFLVWNAEPWKPTPTVKPGELTARLGA